jgi:hypothetical protein
MKVSLEFPDTASLTQFDHDYLKTVLVATLYHLGKLSEHEACVACVFHGFLPPSPRKACHPVQRKLVLAHFP